MKIRPLSGFIKGDNGTSLPELLVVSALMVIVLGTIYMVFGATVAIADQAQARAEAADDSRLGVDRITRELRQAQEMTEGQGVFTVFQDRQCTFYCDVTRDGRPERIRYYVSNNAVYRTQANPTTQFPPYAYSAESAPIRLIKKLKPDWTGAIFQYYTNDSPPVRITAGSGADISAVKVLMINQATSGKRTVNVTADTWVKIRSVRNDLN